MIIKKLDRERVINLKVISNLELSAIVILFYVQLTYLYFNNDYFTTFFRIINQRFVLLQSKDLYY